MPISLRARSSTASTPDLRSLTSAAKALLRRSSSPFPVFCAATWLRNSTTCRQLPCPNHSLACSSASTAASTTNGQRRRFRVSIGSAVQAHERAAAGVAGLGAQRLLDAQQLVVLGHAVAAAQRAGLDLGGGGGHGDVGDGGVFGLARAVRDDGGVAVGVGQRNRLQGFGERADLVDLDQDGVGHLLVDAVLEALRIGQEKGVAD